MSNHTHRHEGKLFRLDIKLGNKAGGNSHKTEYIWLCAPCAQVMHPKIEVRGDIVRLLLTKNPPTSSSRIDCGNTERYATVGLPTN